MNQTLVRKTWGALWLVYLVWGSTYLAIELAIRTMPPLLSMGARFLAASLLLGLFLQIKFGKKAFHINLRQLLALALLGGLLLGLGLGMVTLAQFNNVPTGMVALLISALPFWIAIFKAIEGSKTSYLSWVGIFLGFIGVGILLQPELSKPNNATHIFWMLMVIIGNLGWAFGTYISPRLELPKNTFVITFYQMILGGVGMSLAGILAGEALSDFFDASLASWGWWLYLVIIGSILTYSAYLWLVANAPVGLISTYAYVNPVIAVFLGVLFLEEKLSITLLLGAVIVITGVFIVVRVESKEAQKVKVGINE